MTNQEDKNDLLLRFIEWSDKLTAKFDATIFELRESTIRSETNIIQMKETVDKLSEKLDKKEDKSKVWSYLGVLATLSLGLFFFLYDKVNSCEDGLVDVNKTVTSIQSILEYKYDIIKPKKK